MERLTHINGNGDIYFIVDGKKVYVDDVVMLRIAEKLKHYEDIENRGSY